MRILFICNQNENRSKTAEMIFKDKFKTRSAGLFNENPVTEKELNWADVIVVMEDFQRKEIADRFPNLYLKKRIISLGIPDSYNYMQPELANLLNLKMRNLF